MSDVVYRIVEHDGGWAYKLGEVFSETFPSRQSAEAAAKMVAQEQRIPGEDESISWEDDRGIWHDEAARGADRPNAYVAGAEAIERSTSAQQSRSIERGGADLDAPDYIRSLAAEGHRRRPKGQVARGEVRSDPLLVMLLTIAFAYVLGIVVGRNA